MWQIIGRRVLGRIPDNPKLGTLYKSIRRENVSLFVTFQILRDLIKISDYPLLTTEPVLDSWERNILRVPTRH